MLSSKFSVPMLPLAAALLLWVLATNAMLAAPLSPVRCDVATGACMVFNAYGTWPDRSFCKVGEAAFPSTEQELVDIVAHGVKNRMKMKVVSNSAHSFPKFACPGGTSGLVISTAKYSSRVVINASSMTVTADSGVELSRLLQEIGSHGLALPSSPYWNGISLGGLLSTGSHGSSLMGKGSAVHEYVKAMTMVVPATEQEGFAKIVKITDQDEDFMNAAKVSLGVLGVISQVTLSLQPIFKRSVTKFEASDINLEREILEFGKNHEFGDVSWYPSKYKVIYRADDRVPVSTSGDGVNDFTGFQPTLATAVEAQRILEEGFEISGDHTGKCATGLVQTQALFATGEGFKSSGGVFIGYPVVGFQHKIQSSGGCQASLSRQLVCPWDPTVRGLFYHQTTVSISVDKIQDFITDVKTLRALNPAALCGVDLYNGFLMRYVRASSAYLGKQTDAVDVDITYYRARSGNTPRLNEDVLEEVEQMALFKYGGLPHWGKNRNIAFGTHTAAKYPKLQKFLVVKSKFDPDGFFSSEWSDFALGISGGSSNLPHCALEGECVCSLDSHCAPENYYFCRPGRVYTDAQVCRFVPPGTA
ncbi:L-gulonolactone oxidase 3 [Selaginella moellendorffii]|nr:L-gulonolactone oxidase 3 [Selaginella moellendorffii]|eukprot:XP_002992203.2 L-gulonolactone oxidase 3 [Selaginella moellendorffii]